MKKTFPFYLLAVSIFLIIISPFLLSRGMFLDGIVYANFSKNYAIGEGTFLNPFFSQTFLVDFKSHPPMFFFLEGQFFKVFGTSFLIERFYSVLSILIACLLTLKLYKKFDFKMPFLPLFFFLSIPLMTWSVVNNIIENTLIIFTTSSVLFYTYSLSKKRILFIFLAGLSLTIGFSVKGFVAFFPLSFPFIYWLVIRKTNFLRMLTDSILIFLFSIIPILLSIYLSQDVKDYFDHYFEIQIIGGLQNSITVNSRFYILGRFFSELIFSFIILGIYFLVHKLKIRKNPLKNNENNKKALLMFLFSLTAVLPILLSMKQSGFYLLPAFPFVVIAFSGLIDESVSKLISNINPKIKWFSTLKYISIVLLIISIFLPFLFYGKDSRDKELLADMDIIAEFIPQKSILSIPPQMLEEYSLFAYYARFHNISIDRNIKVQRKYLLIRKEHSYNFKKMNYKKVNLNTQSYNIYEKEN